MKSCAILNIHDILGCSSEVPGHIRGIPNEFSLSWAILTPSPHWISQVASSKLVKIKAKLQKPALSMKGKGVVKGLSL